MLSLTFLFPVISSLFQTELVFFSGKSGDPIGSRVDVDVNGVFAHLQFHTSTGAPYLLLLTGVCLMITASVLSSASLHSVYTGCDAAQQKSALEPIVIVNVLHTGCGVTRQSHKDKLCVVSCGAGHGKCRHSVKLL